MALRIPIFKPLSTENIRRGLSRSKMMQVESSMIEKNIELEKEIDLLAKRKIRQLASHKYDNIKDDETYEEEHPLTEKQKMNEVIEQIQMAPIDVSSKTPYRNRMLELYSMGLSPVQVSKILTNEKYVGGSLPTVISRSKELIEEGAIIEIPKGKRGAKPKGEKVKKEVEKIEKKTKEV